MKTSISSLTTSFVIAALAVLSACGGGGGGSSAPAGPAVSKGVITAKGSVFVNGIRFSTTGATIRVDDNPGTENDLKVGMVIKVRGVSDDATNTGTATLIEARDALEGTISSVDAAGNTITVMGQVVKIEDNVTRLNDDDTVKVFAGANFVVGDRVEVDGFPDDNGGLRATRVAKKTTGEFEVKGYINSQGANSFTLSLTPGGAATLTVNFANGALPAGAVNGSLVAVKSSAAPVAGAITASLIKLEERLGAAGEKVEAEGVVTSGTVADFMINGQRVITNASTVFVGGVAADFAVGGKLEAEGPLDADGTIIATKISFRSNIRLQATATALNATSLTLLGKSVAINQLTRVDNGPIVNGDYLEVRAGLDRDGNLLASRIIKKSASTQAFLQGPVTAVDAGAGSLTILGTALTTNGQTEFRISTNSSEAAVGAAAFFAAITPNVTVVKVRWDNFTALTNAIKQAEIELGK
ncbi:DUF5666 domain-containing protein [Citrifermentans bremense]|uniref:DUF5666 domain-containing protein n=1 Tax=Citrifermentans bremense TaxID=60035 RepID=UPI0004024193|nr:DUF5666 domain-containing protein [Citrifermentans bremense]